MENRTSDEHYQSLDTINQKLYSHNENAKPVTHGDVLRSSAEGFLWNVGLFIKTVPTSASQHSIQTKQC